MGERKDLKQIYHLQQLKDLSWLNFKTCFQDDLATIKWTGPQYYESIVRYLDASCIAKMKYLLIKICAKVKVWYFSTTSCTGVFYSALIKLGLGLQTYGCLVPAIGFLSISLSFSWPRHPPLPPPWLAWRFSLKTSFVRPRRVSSACMYTPYTLYTWLILWPCRADNICWSDDESGISFCSREFLYVPFYEGCKSPQNSFAISLSLHYMTLDKIYSGETYRLILFIFYILNNGIIKDISVKNMKKKHTSAIVQIH